MHSRREFVTGLAAVILPTVLPKSLFAEETYAPLQLTSKNYAEIKALLPEGYRVSSAADEFSMIENCVQGGGDPADVFYRELFNEEGLIQITSTTLKIPKGLKPGAYELDKDGRKYSHRLVFVDGTETGKVVVPHSGAMPEVRIVPEISYEDPENPREVPRTPLTTILDTNGLPKTADDSSNLSYREHIYHYWLFDTEATEAVVYLSAHPKGCLLLSATKLPERNVFAFRPKRI